MLKFEYLSNPYYNDIGTEGLEPINDIQVKIEQLTKELNSFDVDSHKLYYEKIVRSFGNLKFRWNKVHESGTLTPPQIKLDCEEILDRHMGFFAY